MAGIGRVGAGVRVEDAGDESVETNELIEEVDIGLSKRSRFRIEDFCLRTLSKPLPPYMSSATTTPQRIVWL